MTDSTSLEILVNAQIERECSRLPPMSHRATARAVATRLIPLGLVWRLVRGRRGEPPRARIAP